MLGEEGTVAWVFYTLGRDQQEDESASQILQHTTIWYRAKYREYSQQNLRGVSQSIVSLSKWLESKLCSQVREFFQIV